MSATATMTAVAIQPGTRNTRPNLSESMYVFPAPSSVPPSPAATISSNVSVPTDMNFPSSLEASSDRSSVLWAEQTSQSSMGRPRTMSVDTGSEVDAEVWDLTGSEVESKENSTAAFEAAIENAHRYDALHRRPLGEATPLASQNINSSDQGPKYLQQATITPAWERAHQLRPMHLKPMSKSRPPISHTPLRSPVLAFFSAVLSVDESTVNLLTRPQTNDSSPLFPSPLLSDTLRVAEDMGREKKALLSLGTIQPELKSLKEGMQFVCDPAVYPLVGNSSA